MPHRLDLRRLDLAFTNLGADVEAGRASTAVLGVATASEVVRLEAFGQSGGEPVTPEHVFLLASVTKPIVATAVMQLVAEGRLLLDEPLGRHLPEMSGRGRPDVTARHLLTHTSGLPEIDWPTTLQQLPERAVSFEAACSETPLFLPGSSFSYSTLTFYLLAELITRLSGRPFTDYLEARVFGPFGMASTSFDPREQRGRMVEVEGITEPGGPSVEAATDAFISFAMPGAGLWSTAGDLIRFGQALLRRDANLLPALYVELMGRDQTKGMVERGVNAGARHQALGWRKGKADGFDVVPGSPSVVEHDGATGGQLWLDPEHDLIFVYLTNRFGADAGVRQRALQVVYGSLK